VKTSKNGSVRWTAGGTRSMKTNSKRSVIVVGGGIGGLAVSLALAKKGVSVRLFEQAPEIKEIGAGIQLGPNVFRMFECLGITNEVNKLAVFPESLMMLDSVTGQEVTRICLDEPFLNRFEYPLSTVRICIVFYLRRVNNTGSN
jgi:salicylate hydroxylase